MEFDVSKKFGQLQRFLFPAKSSLMKTTLPMTGQVQSVNRAFEFNDNLGFMTGQVHSVNRAFEFNDNLGFIFGIILKFAALCFEIPLEENIRALLRFSGRKQSSSENENGSVGR